MIGTEPGIWVDIKRDTPTTVFIGVRIGVVFASPLIAMDTQPLPISRRIFLLSLLYGQFLVVFVANSTLVVDNAKTLGKAVLTGFAFVALVAIVRALIFIIKSHGIVIDDVLLGFGLPGWLRFIAPGLTFPTFFWRTVWPV